MKIDERLLLRKVGKDYMVVCTDANFFNGMVKLNKTTATLWQFFCQDNTKENAVEFMMTAYDLPQKTAEFDVEKFIKLAKENSFLVD